MDFALTQIYRKVYHDIVLIYDVARYCQKRKLVGSFINNFAEALALAMATEASDLENLPPPILSASTIETEQERLRIQWEVFTEFMHSIVVQFSCEELSQFPFFSAKVLTAIANDSITATEAGRNMSIFQLFKASSYSLVSRPLSLLINGGVIALYEGCLPFLSAACIYNFSQLQLSVQRFMATIMYVFCC
jgi:hypothetical protein